MIPHKEYEQVLKENPELYWHPDYITSPDCNSRDFEYQERYEVTPDDDVD